MKYRIQENTRLQERIYTALHPSGLRVVVIPKAHRKAFALLGTRYGSIHREFKTDRDEDFITVPDGVAHFLEHKLFENEDGSDTFNHFAALGASCNAFTSNEMTAYLFSATENYYENLKVLLNFVTHPYFTPETVQKEMGIIGQEIRMVGDDPFHQLYYGLMDALFIRHNVKVDVAGTEETIAQIDDSVLYRCYNTFYNLKNMLLVLCGPWDGAKVTKVMDECLTKAEPIFLETRFPREPKKVNHKRVIKEFPVPIPLFAIGMKESDLASASRAKNVLKMHAEHEILSDLLFGKSSELYNELYESGIVGDKFSVEYNLSRSFGYLMIYGESRKPGVVYEKVKKVVATAADRFTEEDFERSRRAVYARSIQDWNSTTEIAESYMDFAFSGADMLHYPDTIAAVTMEDLKERIRRSYRADRVVQSVVRPGKEKKV